MRALGIAFEERLVPFGGPADPHDFHAFSPTGRVPCLVDGDRVVWDSLAISEYLAEDAPAVWPADRTARAWARCASAEMHAGFAELRNVCTMNCGLRVRLLDMSAALKADVARIDALWCEGLARFGGPFLAGDAFTAVDAFFAPVAFRVQTYALALSPQPGRCDGCWRGRHAGWYPRRWRSPARLAHEARRSRWARSQRISQGGRRGRDRLKPAHHRGGGCRTPTWATRVVERRHGPSATILFAARALSHPA